MCGRNVSLQSRVTPSVLTVSESGTAVNARSMLESKGKARSALPRTKQDCLRLVWVYGQTIETELCTWMRDTLQVLVYQTDQCVTEQYGVGYHLHTVVAGFQSA